MKHQADLFALRGSIIE